MVGAIVLKLRGLMDIFSYHRKMLDKLKQLEDERKGYDERIENLTTATMDGDEGWFLEFVKRNPSCAMKVIEECDKRK